MVEPKAPEILPRHADPEIWTAGVGVAILDFEGRSALFHQGRQELVELNDTARLIWERLAARYSPAAVTASLVEDGVPGQDAGAFVEQALQHWREDGWIVPERAPCEPGDAAVMLELCVLDVGFHLAFSGAPPTREVMDFLRPLRGVRPYKRRVHVVAWRDECILYVDGASRGLVKPGQFLPALKAVLTEHLVASVSDGFVAHGALVKRGSQMMFLSGAAGAGKSTLALALACAGFECLADDIVHVDGRGLMRGAPFAPTLKSGSWPLFSGKISDLDRLEIHHRADGQRVRYLPKLLSGGLAGRLSHFIVIDRIATDRAELSLISGLEALRTLLASAFASRGAISMAEITGLAAEFRAVQCHVLRYSNVWQAATILQKLADE